MNYSTKKAFTLIELVISIVIIALASATLPIMLGSANKLQEQTINQDIFFKSITVMTDIVSKSWDKVPENDISITSGSPLNTSDVGNTMIWYLPHSNGNIDLNATVGIGTPKLYRHGSLQNFNYRKFYSTTDIADVHASDMSSSVAQLDSNAKYENINEYNNKYISESSADGANVDYNISVRYVEDNVTTTGKKQSAVWSLGGTTNTSTAATSSTNLKRITISATRNMGGEDMKVGFAYFSSNIGVSGLKTDPQ